MPPAPGCTHKCLQSRAAHTNAPRAGLHTQMPPEPGCTRKCPQSRLHTQMPPEPGCKSAPKLRRAGRRCQSSLTFGPPSSARQGPSFLQSPMPTTVQSDSSFKELRRLDRAAHPPLGVGVQKGLAHRRVTQHGLRRPRRGEKSEQGNSVGTIHIPSDPLSENLLPPRAYTIV